MICSIDQNIVKSIVASSIGNPVEPSLRAIDSEYREKLYREYDNIQEAKQAVDGLIADVVLELDSIKNDSKKLKEFGIDKDDLNSFLKSVTIDGKYSVSEIVKISSDLFNIEYNNEDEINDFVNKVNNKVPVFTTESVLLQRNKETTDAVFFGLKKEEPLIQIKAKVTPLKEVILLSVSDIVNNSINGIEDIYTKANKQRTPEKNPYLDFGNFIDSFVKEMLTGEYGGYLVEIVEELKNSQKLKQLYKGNDFESYIDSVHLSIAKIKIDLQDYEIINGDRVKLNSLSLKTSGITDIILINKKTKEVSILDVKSSLKFSLEEQTDFVIKKHNEQISIYSEILKEYLPEGYTMNNKNFILYINGDYKNIKQVKLSSYKKLDSESLVEKIKKQVRNNQKNRFMLSNSGLIIRG